MQPDSNGMSRSLWLATETAPPFPALTSDATTDVCVIGAGIGGLTTAYLLACAGKSVVVIDAIGIGAGETGRTTAHFFPPDEWYASLEDSFGTEQAAQISSSYKAATDLVESIIASEAIDCHFERLPGYLFSLAKEGHEEIENEFQAAQRAGAESTKLERVPGLSFDSGVCIEFQRLAQFHPMKYLNGLAKAIVKRGGKIFCGTRASAITHNDDGHVVNTQGGNISSAAVVVATNTPFNKETMLTHTKQAPYQTYVVGVRVPKGSVPRVLLWDTGDPYYYVRLAEDDQQPDYDILVVGGADHKTGHDKHPQHRYDQLEQWVRERFPMALSVEYRWSGQVMEPADGLAYLGRNPLGDKNTYIITGDSGNGMTHCTIGAMIISDLICGRENKWEALYSPKRKITHGLAEFFSEQADVAMKYSEWLSAGEVKSVEDIRHGEGAIVREGIHKLAVYRDEQGSLHSLSAKCTHMGCVVHFNAAERSWDCPCHGSRFSTSGDVLHGPATSPLSKAGN
ncbi:FAD-dependent oxidoreductase [Cellvibrio sp. ARAG 10.3]|uniref:FAD-dependent oxidoreductase n=1 Tax=Cellvibrio sp. ARAG 10.3 TaxID=3451358 RepID=UPI003F47571D